MEEQIEDVKARDMLIDALLEASSQSEGKLLETVSESLLALDKEFWLRFALRTDQCETGEEKEKMATLANSVMKITELIVKQSETSLDNAQTWLIKLLQEAADENGQWHLPLDESEIDKMRQFMKEKLMKTAGQETTLPQAGEEECDMESLLATAYAWMRKAMDDAENKEAQGLVPLLQKVLQLYASEYLLNHSQTNPLQAENDALEAAGEIQFSLPAREAMDKLVKSDEKEWSAQLEQLAEQQACTEDALLVELQKKKELIILGMRGGMYEQRVLVEYLQELEERVKLAFGGEGEETSTKSTDS